MQHGDGNETPVKDTRYMTFSNNNLSELKKHQATAKTKRLEMNPKYKSERASLLKGKTV